MEYDGWYEEVREYTRRLVSVYSVSPGAGETEAAREVLRLLHDGGMAAAYTESGLDPIADDPYGRHNAYAVLRGRSARAVVLLGHVDTVQTADYGPLEPWALDPAGLAARRQELLALAPDVASDLEASPDAWMTWPLWIMLYSCDLHDLYSANWVGTGQDGGRHE